MELVRCDLCGKMTIPATAYGWLNLKAISFKCADDPQLMDVCADCVKRVKGLAETEEVGGDAGEER